jgi:hypothetical protein
MLRYWTGTIDGVALEEAPGLPCGFQVIGAEAFETAVTGNTTPAANGFPQTQYTPLGDYGKVIEVHFIHIPGALLRTLLTALAARIAAGTSAAIVLADGFQTISKSAKPNVPDWYSRGEPDGDYVKDAVIRLITTGA